MFAPVESVDASITCKQHQMTVGNPPFELRRRIAGLLAEAAELDLRCGRHPGGGSGERVPEPWVVGPKGLPTRYPPLAL